MFTYFQQSARDISIPPSFYLISNCHCTIDLLPSCERFLSTMYELSRGLCTLCLAVWFQVCVIFPHFLFLPSALTGLPSLPSLTCFSHLIKEKLPLWAEAMSFFSRGSAVPQTGQYFWRAILFIFIGHIFSLVAFQCSSFPVQRFAETFVTRLIPWLINK